MTFKIKNHYYNYDNVSSVEFLPERGVITVWDNAGKSDVTGGLKEEDVLAAKEKFETCYISDFVFIDLTDKEE